MSQLKYFAWPLLILALCLLFREPLKKLIDPDKSKELIFKADAKGITIKRVAAEAATIAANTAKSARQNNTQIDAEALSENIKTGIDISLRASPGIAKERSILWVDDIPSNNDDLAALFSSIGIKVTIAKSTEEAERYLMNSKFDIIITDMSRPPNNEAGLELIEYIKIHKISTPVVIYAAQWSSVHRGQEAERGAILITNDPSEVYSTVLKRLLGAPS